MRHSILLLLIGLIISLSSCRNDFDFEPSTGGLEFSRDTVYLDTVFSNIGSSTYTLKVYNRSDKDIAIPSLKLKRADSKYRLMVDGIPGKAFNNVELMAKDSMFIFIETTANIADANTDDFLYTDEIEFSSTNGTQAVNLVTLIQDAIFIKPNRPLPTDAKETLTINGMSSSIQGHELTTGEELHWTNAKPYVVYGYALVPNGKTLEIDAGARVHFHAESGLIVDNTAILKINGEHSATEAMEKEVVFEGDRLEPGFADVPGQWGSILLMSGSTENTINHLTLKNATVGLLLQRVDEGAIAPRLTIRNSQLYNCANFGILARGAAINAENMVANNCGQASVALTLGGTYNFKHCTIANYFNAYNQVPLLINDYQESGNIILLSDLDARFDNCIIYGSNNIGLSLEHRAAETTFNYTFNHCYIKIIDTGRQLANNPLYNFTGSNYINCVIAVSSTSEKPEFLDPNKNKLNIKNESAANGRGDGSNSIPFDIINTPRTSPIDIGAYESVAIE